MLLSAASTSAIRELKLSRPVFRMRKPDSPGCAFRCEEKLRDNSVFAWAGSAKVAGRSADGNTSAHPAAQRIGRRGQENAFLCHLTHGPLITPRRAQSIEPYLHGWVVLRRSRRV